MRGGRVSGRWPSVAAVALVLLAACSTPEPNRGARDGVDRPAPSDTTPSPGEGGTRTDATLTGRILGPDGEPLVGAPVTVVESPDSLGLDGALAAIFTLGLACISVDLDCTGDERVVDAGTTDDAGRYELTLPAAYLPGFETDEDWVLQVGRAPVDGELTGPSSSFELEVNTRVQEAPDLVVWDGTPSVAEQRDLLRVDIPPLRGDGGLERLAPRFVDDRGQVLWAVEGTTVDPRVLEDRPARLLSTGSADVTVRHEDGRTIYHQQVSTASVPYAGTLVPASRAMPCTSSAGPLVGCPYTDGDLLTRTELQPDERITVDLGTEVEVGLVVVRAIGSHLRDDLVVEISVDGATWTQLPHRALTGTNGWSAGPRSGDGTPTARHVRIGGGTLELSEVSVWPPSEAERAAARPDAVDGDRSGGPDEGDDVPGALALAAGALVLVVGGAAVGARRRTRI